MFHVFSSFLDIRVPVLTQFRNRIPFMILRDFGVNVNQNPQEKLSFGDYVKSMISFLCNLPIPVETCLSNQKKQGPN